MDTVTSRNSHVRDLVDRHEDDVGGVCGDRAPAEPAAPCAEAAPR
ncbi:MAG TPA: hypothetical protein VFV66_33920 [Nonomuraea sp.]|nr:hypothetical protein [Nonomuraea sp.]